MRFIRVVQAICCALLLLVFSLSAAAAQSSFVRITATNPWGFVITQTITESPTGAVGSKEVQYPGSATVKRGDIAMSRAQFASMADELIALGVAELGDVVEPGIEDAATYHFEGVIGGQTIDFKVYGVLRDLQDTRYAGIMRAIQKTTDEIQMEEVAR